MKLSERPITNKNSRVLVPHDILIVDDEKDIRLLTAGILEDEGYQTRQAHDSKSAIESM